MTLISMDNFPRLAKEFFFGGLHPYNTLSHSTLSHTHAHTIYAVVSVSLAASPSDVVVLDTDNFDRMTKEVWLPREPYIPTKTALYLHIKSPLFPQKEPSILTKRLTSNAVVLYTDHLHCMTSEVWL